MPLKKNFKLAIVLTPPKVELPVRGRPLYAAPAVSDLILPAYALCSLYHGGAGQVAGPLPTLHSPVHSQTVRTTHGLSRLHHCSTPQTWPSLPGPSPPCEQSNIFLKFKEENGAESWILVSLCHLYLWFCYQTIIIFSII